jgi:hypothetical protein
VAAALARAALGAAGATYQSDYSGTADPAENRQTPIEQQPVASSSKTGDKDTSLSVISPECCLCEKVPRIHEDESIYISQCDNRHYAKSATSNSSNAQFVGQNLRQEIVLQKNT